MLINGTVVKVSIPSVFKFTTYQFYHDKLATVQSHMLNHPTIYTVQLIDSPCSQFLVPDHWLTIISLPPIIKDL